MAGEIFINYRRDDEKAAAGRLFDRLTQAFGRKCVFMDVDNIPPGVDFLKVLKDRLATCQVLLVIIGRRWLDIRDAQGNRRLDDPEDYVAIEIAAALLRGIHVIPVLIDGACMPRDFDLPVPLKALSRRNAVELRQEYFGRDSDALIAKIREILGAQNLFGQSLLKIGAVLLALSIAVVGSIFLFRIQDRVVQTEGKCTTNPTFHCIKEGKIIGQIYTAISGVECKNMDIYNSNDSALRWKDIWTTSMYSFAPGGGGPGGGLHNENLEVGGWGDWYYSLIQFEIPKSINAPVSFVGLLLYAKPSGGQPVPLFLDRILTPWGWKEGDRLWWKDKPEVTPQYGSPLPAPEPDKWYVIDMTTLYRWWTSGTFPNYGIQLRPSENWNQKDIFSSSLDSDVTRRPRLIVCR